ncbi:hypothetical protein I350_08335 [Cryptococcus amylolentus CBS 6273]|uniref:Protein kinase domain-containing protein n=1 Tax=Cryptococcus amylolentus CBS 6273 TaxID=1296118 RepID=A0A1E3J624_9TREE|nr:hypothetical protein I350_08335 [Cryptococcus amylolentus CBS 6273]
MADDMPHDVPSATVRLIASVPLLPVTYDTDYHAGVSQTSAKNRNAYLQPFRRAVCQHDPGLLRQIFHNNVYPVPDADLDLSIANEAAVLIRRHGAERHHRNLPGEIGLQRLIATFLTSICESLGERSSEPQMLSRLWDFDSLRGICTDIILRTNLTPNTTIVGIEVTSSPELSVEEMKMLVEAVRLRLVSVGHDMNGNLIVKIDWDRMPAMYQPTRRNDRDHQKRVCAILGQVMCYLVKYHSNHGVITNYEAWIALHVTGTRDNPILQVSDVLYREDQPTEDSPWSSPLGLLLCYHFLRDPGEIVLPAVSKPRTAAKQGVSRGRRPRGTGGPAKMRSSQHPTPRSEAGLPSNRIGESFERNAQHDGTCSTASAGYSYGPQQSPARNMVTPPLTHSSTGTDSSPEQPSPNDIPIKRPFQIEGLGIEGLGRQDERAPSVKDNVLRGLGSHPAGVSLVLDFDRIQLSQAVVGKCRFLHLMPSPSLPFLRLDRHDEAGYLRHSLSNKYPSDDMILSDAIEHDPPTSGFVVSDGLSHDVNGYSLASHTDICSTTTIILEEPLDSGAVWDVYYASSPLQTCVVKVSAPEAFPDDSDEPVYIRAEALQLIMREWMVYNTKLLDLQGTVVPRLWGMWKGSQPHPDGGTIDLYISVMSNPGCMLTCNESDYNAESDCNESDHNAESDCSEWEYNGESDWSVEEKMVIVAQYTRLHNAGVLHGDVSPRHWIRAAGVPSPTDSTSLPTPSIFLIDFGLSVTIDMLGKAAWEQKTRKEMQLVRSFLHL